MMMFQKVYYSIMYMDNILFLCSGEVKMQVRVRSQQALLKDKLAIGAARLGGHNATFNTDFNLCDFSLSLSFEGEAIQ